MTYSGPYNGPHACGPDPTKPWYVYRLRDMEDDSESVRVTQLPPPKPEQFDPADIVPAEWISVDRCRQKKPHPPHTWGGEGWSPFTCKGVE